MLEVANGSSFDTSNDCRAGSVLGDCAPVPMGSTEICVCRADTLTIQDLEVRGSRGLAILAWSSVTVKGTLVMKPGTGASTAQASDDEGGSFGTVGGNGGPATYGMLSLVPLVGGMSGKAPLGGIGGGALQITADAMVRVEGTISVPGGGGRVSSSCDTAYYGAGGGSGGALLLEARRVDIVGGLAANGGGGSGGGISKLSDGSDICGTKGEDGLASTERALGGDEARITCNGSTFPYAWGGTGGDGSRNDTAGLNSASSKNGESALCGDYNGYGGGGGGGAGRIRVNSHYPCGCGGFLSPTPTFSVVVIE
jgi:hypothetical protein